jgi:hypothetical protein
LRIFDPQEAFGIVQNILTQLIVQIGKCMRLNFANAASDILALTAGNLKEKNANLVHLFVQVCYLFLVVSISVSDFRVGGNV